jgi:hypothetical protein
MDELFANYQEALDHMRFLLYVERYGALALGREDNSKLGRGGILTNCLGEIINGLNVSAKMKLMRLEKPR